MRVNWTVVTFCAGLALTFCGLPASGHEPISHEPPDEERGRIILVLHSPENRPHNRSERSDFKQRIAQGLSLDHDNITILEHLPYALVDNAPLAAVRSATSIQGVAASFQDRENVAFSAQSMQIIGQSDAVISGATGAGFTVAVLDTGADYKVADLGACDAPGPNCRVVEAFDAAPNDGTRDDTTRHGTNVASIVARTAPDVTIVAVDVFDGASAFDSDIIRGLDWVYANRQKYDFAAVNLSLGTQSFQAERCTNTPYDAAFASLTSAGIAIVTASGNSATKNALSMPACHPLSVAVGATTDTNFPSPIQWSDCTDSPMGPDLVPCFSNSAQTLRLLAPGHAISAGNATQSGTSQAAPHVAGAIAALRSSSVSSSSAESVQRLAATGRSVVDQANSISTPRINLGAAANREPVALDDSGRIIAGGGGVFDVLANDQDEDVDSLEITGALAPAGCQAFTLERRVFAFCNDTVRGLQEFRYSVRDRYGDTAAAGIEIDVRPGPASFQSDVGRASAFGVVNRSNRASLAWVTRETAPRVLFQPLNSNGTFNGAPFDLARGTSGVVQNHLAIGANDRRATVSWVQVVSGTQRVMGANVGAGIGRPYRASFNADRAATRPFVAHLGSTALVSWQEEWSPTRYLGQLFGARTGNGPIGNLQVLLGYSSPDDTKAVPISETDYLLFRGKPGRPISVRRFDRTGTDIWNSSRTLRATPEVINAFDVIPLNDGTFALSWSETNRWRSSTIWYARVNSDGAFVTDPLRVFDGVQVRGSVALAERSDGTIQVYWIEKARPFAAILSAQVSDAGRIGDARIEHLTTNVRAQFVRKLEVAILPTGREIIMWQEPSEIVRLISREARP